MKKLNICLLLFVVIAGCNCLDGSEEKTLKGATSPSLVRRFENDEVVCYYSYRIGIACKWKEAK